MSAVYEWLFVEHSFPLFVISIVICLAFSVLAVKLTKYLYRPAEQRYRLMWLGLSSVTMGFGVWAAHFIAMLSRQHSVPDQYSIGLVLTAFSLATFMSAVSLSVLLFYKSTGTVVISGLALAMGVLSANYITQYGPVWLPSQVLGSSAFMASAFVGLAGSVIAVFLASQYRRGMPFIWPAVTMAAAILGQHYIGAVATVSGHMSPATVANAVEIRTLSLFSVCLIAVVIGLFVVFAIGMDKYFARRNYANIKRLRILSNAVLEGVVVLDLSGRIMDVNGSFSSLAGSTVRRLKGRLFANCFKSLPPLILKPCRQCQEDAILLSATGEEIPVKLTLKPVQQHRENTFVCIVHDVREQMEAENKINYLASHDTVTGLPNRILFHEKLATAVEKAKRRGSVFALFHIDVDKFKDLNGRIGSKLGDELLKEIGVHLQRLAKDGDVVGRLSADQFCFLRGGLDSQVACQKFITDLRRKMMQHFLIEDHDITLTACLGIALYPDGAESAEHLLDRAELALKRAKAQGANRYCFYESAVDKKLEQRRALKHDLIGALGRREFFLVYQPQYHVEDGGLAGFETLVRWKHPVRGIVSPAEFIPLAEETGLIHEIGIWILNEACREAASWGAPYSIAINLSPIQFLEEGMVELIADIVEDTGLDPSRLELEVTEGVLIEDEQLALKVLNELKALGIRLAMDDFGTGYSSLSYLQNFPFDKIKIDRTFVMQMDSDTHSGGIVQGVIGLAHGLGIPVLAEGVETPEQLKMLQEQGCDEAQGYLLGRPENIRTYDAKGLKAKDIVNQ